MHHDRFDDARLAGALCSGSRACGRGHRAVAPLPGLALHRWAPRMPRRSSGPPSILGTAGSSLRRRRLLPVTVVSSSMRMSMESPHCHCTANVVACSPLGFRVRSHFRWHGLSCLSTFLVRCCLCSLASQAAWHAHMYAHTHALQSVAELDYA